MTAPALLSVRDLRVAYPVREGWRRRMRPALQGIDLELRAGETLAIVGESGSGKSTLGRAMLRLVPAEGAILWEGHDIARWPERRLGPFRRAAQMIFQDPYLSLNPRKTVGTILRDALRQAGGRGDREAVEALLSSVGLAAEAAVRYPRAFSGGQRQRVGIARALAVRPRLLVADEPVSALDMSVRAQVVNLLADIRQREGLALAFISHDLGVVRHMADRVAVLYFGRLVEIAEAETFYAAPAHPYSAALLAAAPPPEPRLARRALSATLSGEVPSPARPPPGCAFASRCPRARDRCRAEIPPLRPLGPGRRAACHFPLIPEGPA
ncbi:ABC transporter ATP-binding protein [Rubellimicrobium sp. CFH 75288]|uniref:ABC transporter ATP-binding protein n=1 Tax=Rubellimicrobium sp. CFH 75288 TaxID=2697034 RepID=UPI001411E5B9|nr:oligopeptide/dipeptide ABC transporter ATP-binding protein [Rubellimicrobium sp. CFH 75288]NAZ37365.1 ATP-binding cassette domain-containing protein [Rubellimicrobium sp. CFH 75288]